MSVLDTIPDSTELATTENMDWEFDTTNRLRVGQTLVDATCTLKDDAGTLIPLTDPAIVADNIVTQHVDGSTMIAGANYLLTVTFEVEAPNDVQSAFLRIVVPR